MGPLVSSLGRVRKFTSGVTDLHPVSGFHLDASSFFVKFIERLIDSIIICLLESPMLHEFNIFSTSKTSGSSLRSVVHNSDLFSSVEPWKLFHGVKCRRRCRVNTLRLVGSSNWL